MNISIPKHTILNVIAICNLWNHFYCLEIFKNLIIKNKGIEVNTSGYAVNQTCGFPNFEQVQRYYDLGGRIITIGTDSHTSDRVGQYVNDVKENLIKIGF